MSAIAARYARAFADVVEKNKLDATKTSSDLESLTQLISGSNELRGVWQSPNVNPEQKLKLLDAIASQNGISKQMRNFIAVLISQRRIGLIEDVANEFKSELNNRLGVAEAEVTSARELGAEERSALEAQLAKITGKTIRATYKRDATVLGGAVVRIGSTVYDGSVRGQLTRIKEQMMAQ